MIRENVKIGSALLLNRIRYSNPLFSPFRFEAIMEIWKNVKENNLYDISNYGKVRSWCFNRWGRAKKPRLLKAGISKLGYPMVLMGGSSKYVHRLVIEHFGLPQPSEKHECRHLDGNRENCHIDNLAWGTRKENIADAIRHGTATIGANNGRAKLDRDKIRKIFLHRRNGLNFTQIGRLIGVGRKTISNVIHGKTYKADYEILEALLRDAGGE